ncbi:MAG TPA: rRNA maturation RNase YbeY [Bryobacteraceae bacterium]|nr:rRNA maturation RNase YbeY [Bryobacteraceae bacterium]
MPESHSTFVCGRLPAGLARRNLKAFAARLEREVTGGRTFTCLLADDAELQRLNKQFLDHDYPTDVLSFPASHRPSTIDHRPAAGRRGDEPAAAFIGEIAISLDRAAAQARELGHGLETEVEILLLHGVLHLLGMDHEKDRGRMARAERRHREELGLPAGLIERVRP